MTNSKPATYPHCYCITVGSDAHSVADNTLCFKNRYFKIIRNEKKEVVQILNPDGTSPNPESVAHIVNEFVEVFKQHCTDPLKKNP